MCSNSKHQITKIDNKIKQHNLHEKMSLYLSEFENPKFEKDRNW